MADAVSGFVAEKTRKRVFAVTSGPGSPGWAVPPAASISLTVSAAPWSLLDDLALAAALAGLSIAAAADTQLQTYMAANAARVAAGAPRVPLLETGLWRLSRHTTYFGEPARHPHPSPAPQPRAPCPEPRAPRPNPSPRPLARPHRRQQG